MYLAVLDIAQARPIVRKHLRASIEAGIRDKAAKERCDELPLYTRCAAKPAGVLPVGLPMLVVTTNLRTAGLSPQVLSSTLLLVVN